MDDYLNGEGPSGDNDAASGKKSDKIRYDDNEETCFLNITEEELNQQTAPVNYLIKDKHHNDNEPESEMKPVIPEKQADSPAALNPNMHERHRSQVPNPETGQDDKPKVKPDKKSVNYNVLLACMSSVLLLTVITLAVTFWADNRNDSDDDIEVTKAQTLKKEVQQVIYEDEDAEETDVPETERVTEPETSCVTSAVTEAETSAVTSGPVKTESVNTFSDGRNILDTSENIDADRDGNNDLIEVYRYNSGDIFYDIHFSGGSLMTYTFSSSQNSEILDYLVYDKTSGLVYPASLSTEDSQGKRNVRFMHVYGSTGFSVEYNYDGTKSYWLNYQISDADSVRKYYQNLEILYSYSDSDRSRIGNIINDALA